MKSVIALLFICLFVIGQCHEFKGFTMKQFQFLYQVFTGDFMDMKRKEKLEKAVVRNETTTILGELHNIF